MQGQGRVLAFDRDADRRQRLQDNMNAAGATNVVTQCADFLSLDLSDPRFAASGVQAALVRLPALCGAHMLLSITSAFMAPLIAMCSHCSAGCLVPHPRFGSVSLCGRTDSMTLQESIRM